MMNPNPGYSQANMRSHMTLMPGSSPTYPKASPGQDPYGYGQGPNMFAPMGQQGLTPTGYYQDPSLYAPQQQRFGGDQRRAPPTAQQQPHVQPQPQREPAKPKKAECQEECAEEECVDGEQCGNEQRKPKPTELCLGIDTRPFLPLALTTSTIVGMIYELVVEVPEEALMYHMDETLLYTLTAPIYVIVLYCLAFSALVDPGQLPKDYPTGAALINTSNNNDSTDAEDEPQDRNLPRRAHQCWQYKRPVRRYDHYCRWLTNVIGLYNHREFLIMVIGLVMIGVIGACRDVVLLVTMFRRDLLGQSAILVALHLVYSVGLTGVAGPILRIHVGLVSRNEVAHEWKKNSHYIVRKARDGRDNVLVNELSDEEFNQQFDHFEYDASMNSFDNGLMSNCWVFWCTPRWTRDQLGNF